LGGLHLPRFRGLLNFETVLIRSSEKVDWLGRAKETLIPRKYVGDYKRVEVSYVGDWDRDLQLNPRIVLCQNVRT
jgi:hypothetical protein